MRSRLDAHGSQLLFKRYVINPTLYFNHAEKFIRSVSTLRLNRFANEFGRMKEIL